MNINLTLIGQAISFAIFVWFCMKFVWPPITTALEGRANQIADGLAAAEKGRHDLELAEQRATESLRKGKEKAQEFIVHAEKRGDEIVEEAKAAAREESDRIIASARVQIEQERNEAREGLRGEIASLAVVGAEQILMREIDEQAHKALLEELSAQL